MKFGAQNCTLKNCTLKKKDVDDKNPELSSEEPPTNGSICEW